MTDLPDLSGLATVAESIINQLRQQLTKTRAAAAATPPAPSPQQQRVAEQPRNDTGQWAPQAGVTSKAGSSAGVDDSSAGLMEAFFRQNGMTF